MLPHLFGCHTVDNRRSSQNDANFSVHAGLRDWLPFSRGNQMKITHAYLAWSGDVNTLEHPENSKIRDKGCGLFYLPVE